MPRQELVHGSPDNQPELSDQDLPPSAWYKSERAEAWRGPVGSGVGLTVVVGATE